jgi:hypothetical protein
MRHTDVVSNSSRGLATISAKNGVLSQKRRRCNPDMQLVDYVENKIGSISSAVSRYEDRNLLIRNAAPICLATFFARRSFEAGSLPLIRTQEIYLIRLCNANKLLGLSSLILEAKFNKSAH